MAQSVLLLNASYEPIKVISWKRAVCMFFSGKVEVVEEYEHDIRSVSIIIKAPSVVRLVNYVKIKRRTPPLSRLNILARDGFKCQYCGVNLTARNATIDHIQPRSLGGKSTWTNMVCACTDCNCDKGSRTLEQAGYRLLNQPYKPDWLPVVRFKLNGNVPDTWLEFLQSIRIS